MVQFAEAMNEFGRWLVGRLWPLSVELAILAAVVLTALALLRIRSPKVRHWFGCLLLAKPVATLLIASPISLYWFLRPPAEPPAPEPIRPAMVRAVPREMPRRPMPTGWRRPTPGPGEPRPEPPAWQVLDRYGAAALAWLLIASGLGLRLVVGFAYVSFLRRSAEVQRVGPLADALAAAAKALKVRRRVAVALSDAAHGPVLAGTLRPVIVLPRKLAAGLSPEQVKLIFSHELAHVRRWDNLVLVVQRLAEMFLFFHPVVWLCGWWMRREAEAACDDCVVAAYGGPARYADSLTRVAEMRTGLTRRLLLNTFAAAESDFSRRVRRILGRPVGRMTVGLTVASVVALIFIGCLGLPTAAQRKPTAQKEQSSMSAKRSTKTPEELATAVRRKDGKVWIENVPDIKMTERWMRLRGMEILLRHRGEKPSFNDLLVHSGEAFHLCHGTKWELRTGLGMATNPWSNLAETYGYACRWTTPSWFHAMKALPANQRREKTNAFLDEIWRSLEAGRPALLGGAYGQCGTWRVVVGYDRGMEKICYVGGKRAYEWTDLVDQKVKQLGFWDMQVRGPIDVAEFDCGGWLANAAFLLGERSATPTDRDRAVMALRRACAMFRAQPFRTNAYGGVTYHFGEKAYEAWAGDLHELDFPADVNADRPEVPEIYDFSHLWGQVNQIVTGRAAAAEFCGSATKVLPKGADSLQTAARAYREEVAAAKQVFAPFLEAYGENKKQGEVWLSSEAKREAGAAAIRQMLAKERAAVAAIETALAAEGADVQQILAALVPPQPAAEGRGPTLTPLAEARRIKAGDGSGAKVEWAVLLGEWSADAQGRIVGQADQEAYLCRVKPHADDVRITATVRAVEGDEVTLWICGSPQRAEYVGYTLAVSAGGAKLQRAGDDVKRDWETTLRPGRDHAIAFERRGGTLRGFLGAAKKPFIEWADPQPLRGPGHRHLGFYIWQGKTALSKIKVEDLPPEPYTPAKPKPALPTHSIDYSKLKLKGDGMAQDSCSLALQAAARLLGKRPDYETIYALSTNAFAPAIDIGEGCWAWWHMFGRDTGMDIVAGRLGLRIDKLNVPAGTYTPQDPKDMFQRKALAQRRGSLPILRQAMADGSVVLCGYGWQVFTDHGFVPWCWWGIITKAEPDGTILGAQMNGRHDNPLEFVQDCWRVARSEPTLSAHQGDLAVLKRAVERIRGHMARTHDKRLKFGIDAMDLWVKQMATVKYFCAECEEQTKGDPNRGGFCCAMSNANTTINASRVSASYLRKRKSAFKAKARPHVEAAAKRYDRIVKLLTPALTGRGGEAYKQICGNMARQRAHAKVLEQVKAELAAAADAMEKALAAEGVALPAAPAAGASGAATGGAATAPAKTKHREVLLKPAVKAFEAVLKVANHAEEGDGVYPYPQPCVYLVMHWVQMRAAGWKDVDFDTLTAVSGASGLFAYQPGEFMPKYANLMIGMDRRIAEATGFGYEWVRFKDAEDAWRILIESIDSGRPVKGWHLENCAFLGYREAAKAEDRRVYAIGDGPEQYSKWWTWKEFTDWVALVGRWNKFELGRHTRPVRKTAAKAVALRVMKNLVAWSTKPPAAAAKRFPKAAFGLAGIEAYAADCADVAKHKDWCLCHDINPQWTPRNSTAVYLRRLAADGVFPKKVNEHVAAAAKEYKAAFTAWHKTNALLGHGATEKQRQAKSRREAGAALVREALDHEKAALASLRKALALAG